MNPFEDIPWSADEMEDYRKGGSGKTFKRKWIGPSPYELWRLYGRSDALLECPDCGRPTDKREAVAFQMGRCWNCWKESAYPGFHAKATAHLNGKSVGDKPEPEFKKIGGNV